MNEIMNLEKWHEILAQNELLGCLTEDNWNEDYSHSVNLTVKEIRALNNLLTKSVQDYQTCPKCLGQGFICIPSFVPGDAQTFTSSDVTSTCHFCNGEKVIKKLKV